MNLNNYKTRQSVINLKELRCLRSSEMRELTSAVEMGSLVLIVLKKLLKKINVLGIRD